MMQKQSDNIAGLRIPDRFRKRFPDLITTDPESALLRRWNFQRPTSSPSQPILEATPTSDTMVGRKQNFSVFNTALRCDCGHQHYWRDSAIRCTDAMGWEHDIVVCIDKLLSFGFRRSSIHQLANRSDNLTTINANKSIQVIETERCR